LDRPKEALEEFPLESLKMVGYLYRNKVGYAVIRATDGKLHRVKAGNHIGLNFGLIKEVTDTSVIVKELVQDSSGDWTERDSSLQLME
jgi:type IV pilus assembly protein PilP